MKEGTKFIDFFKKEDAASLKAEKTSLADFDANSVVKVEETDLGRKSETSKSEKKGEEKGEEKK